MCIRDSSKQVHSANLSKGTALDGSTSYAKSFQKSIYSGNGILEDGEGKRVGYGNDGWDNLDRSYGTEEYDVFANLLKLVKSEGFNLRAGLDQSLSWSKSISNFVYSATGLIEIKSANGTGENKSNDSWGNLSTGTTTSIFKVIKGVARNTKTISNTLSLAVSGSSTISNSTTDTEFDDNGRYESQVSNGDSFTDDGFGNTSTETLIQTFFTLLGGKFKATTNLTNGGYFRRDLTTGVTGSTSLTFYTANGRIIGGTSYRTSLGTDRWGNYNDSSTNSVMAVFAGSLKALQSLTFSRSRRIDFSWTDSWDTQWFTYDFGGRITGSGSNGSSVGGDGFVWENFGNTITRHFIAFGSPVPFESYTRSYNANVRGEWTESAQVTRFFYTYFPTWINYAFGATGQLAIGIDMANVIVSPPGPQQDHLYPHMPRSPEVSVWYLGGQIQDPFAASGVTPFLATQQQAEFQTRSFAGGSMTTEVNGFRRGVVIGNTNIIRDIHEEVGYSAVSRMTIVNMTGWYPIDLSILSLIHI